MIELNRNCPTFFLHCRKTLNVLIHPLLKTFFFYLSLCVESITNVKDAHYYFLQNEKCLYHTVMTYFVRGLSKSFKNKKPSKGLFQVRHV